MIKNWIIFISIISLFSCEPSDRVYVEHQELSPKVEWLKKDSRIFKIGITDTKQAYDLSLSFRYATGYQFQIAKVKVTQTSPDGKKNVTEHELKIRDEKGEYLGEAGFEIWDSEHVIFPGITFEKAGEYTFLIEHNMPVDPLNYAMEIGVVLDKKMSLK